MNENGTKTKYVKAIHPFKPTHTDELSFQKGDIIQVMQMIEGGWWEGMHNGTTGWFPSNYVTEIPAGVGLDGAIPPKGTPSKNLEPKLSNKESDNRDLVLQSLQSTEKAFVTDMERLVQSFLKNLEAKSILTHGDNSTLVSSLEDIILLHTAILRDLESTFRLKTSNQKIGQMFLKLASQMQTTHRKYCSIHPKIAILLQAKKDEVNAVMESLGVQGTGLMTLTSFLSRPLRRLERYPSVMQEIDRHSEESHPDRTDLLKAITVYRDIYHACNNIRRQKEMEQDVLCSEIKGWEGEPITQLGDIQLISHCWVATLSQSSTVPCLPLPDGVEKKDRLLILCPGVLLLLSVSPRISGYSFESKIPTYGTMVSPLAGEGDQFPNAFEIISSSTNVRLLVSCNTQQEKNKWLQVLRQPVKLGPVAAVSKNIHHQQNSVVGTPPGSCQLQSPTASNTPAPVSGFQPGNRASAAFNRPSDRSSNPQFFGTPLPHNGISNPPTFDANVVTLSQSHFYLPSLISSGVNPNFPAGRQSRSLISNLRPYPPLRPSFLVKDDGTRSPRSNRRLVGSGRKKPAQLRERLLTQEEILVYKKIDDTKVLQEDALMLKVIESYCTSAKNRQAVNSSIFDGPQVLIAEEEKIILEEARDNQIVVEEKTLVDTVYSLRDQVKELKQEQHALRKELESERNARKNLEQLVRHALKSTSQAAGKQEPGSNQSTSLQANSLVQSNAINGVNNGNRDA